MDRKAHWEGIYSKKLTTEVSWYQAEPTRSLELLGLAAMAPDDAIIDVGGGDSTLVDRLVERHLGRVTVLDISEAALARVRTRLGSRAADVTWIEGDVTRTALPPHAYDVWHDRAAFHFLTESEDRQRYVEAAAGAIRPGGTLIVATFAADGPERCSGLPVARYGAEDLARTFGAEFTLLRGLGDVHRTPAGVEQRFTYAVMQRR